MLFSRILICRYVIFFRLDEILPATGRFSSSTLASPFSEVRHYCQSKQNFHVSLWRLLFLRRNIATIDSPARFSFTALASPFFKVRQYYQPQPIFICHFGVSIFTRRDYSISLMSNTIRCYPSEGQTTYIYLYSPFCVIFGDRSHCPPTDLDDSCLVNCSGLP